MKVEVAVLGSPSLIARTVPLCCHRRASDGDLRLRSCVSEDRGGRPGIPVPNSPYSSAVLSSESF